MSYRSPLANPEAHLSKVRGLSAEGIIIDKSVARGQRAAVEFSRKYSPDFQLVSDLQVRTEQFNNHWTTTLLQSRDAASSISSWLNRFVQVFLAMIGDIQSDSDLKDVIAEFNSFLNEEFPSSKHALDGVPGVKAGFNSIEQAVKTEAKHVVQVLETTKDWRKAVEVLRKEQAAVNGGCAQLRNALNEYATRLD